MPLPPLFRYQRSLCLVILVLLAGTSAAQQADPTQAGPYDNGKMWTFEYPPLDYLAETYDFHPDAAWFERARLSALRLPNCSAAFISPNGLVVTNHHCVRARVSQLSRPGENLLDDGFYAASVGDERLIPGLYLDQLVAIEDVTAEVDAALAGRQTDAERAAARQDAFAEIEARLQAARPGETIQVQLIALYNGGRHSAYVFRRYTDVRLVMAVELALGFFGGEPDNFTYPRYALDFSFLRVYDDDGQPLASPHHFSWSPAGVAEGDLVFVIGNPGATTRLETMAQLEYRRDVQVRHTLHMLNNRLDAMRAAYDEDPAAGEAVDLRNVIFAVSNTQKAYHGRQAALDDPLIMARKADAERQFREALATGTEQQAALDGLFHRMAELQLHKRELGPAYGAFRLIDNALFSSATLRRAILAYRYLRRQAQGDPSGATALKAELLQVGDWPTGLERRLLAARLSEFALHFGADDSTQRVLGSATPAEAAVTLMNGSALSTAARTAEAVTAGTLTIDDPALRLAAAFMPRYQDFLSGTAGLEAREQELARALGRARFDVYGTAVPPDATFSPRFTDGVVKGYAYNGTKAPPYTTFYGLYDHAHSYPGDPDWQLPERWRHPHPDLDLATPLNFISTSDTIGGNSGSPVVTRNLELVGLNFDRNIEGLSRDYIYLPERGRNIMVDMRAVRAALDVIYDADRIVLELTQGRFVPTEEAADAIMQ